MGLPHMHKHKYMLIQKTYLAYRIVIPAKAGMTTRVQEHFSDKHAEIANVAHKLGIEPIFWPVSARVKYQVVLINNDR